MMTGEQAEYARYKSRETSRWVVVDYRAYRRNMPLLNAAYFERFKDAMKRYQHPHAVCIARRGAIMVWRKADGA